MIKFLIIALSLTLVTSNDHWVILVSGSKSYANYRHQSDIFHAYQLVRKNGIPKEHIITFAYDDIADNEQNPTPGKLCNKPNGDNVYEGVEIDYKGDACTSKNFLAVIKGEKSKVKGGSGRVLESKAEDNVFIFYNDHGSPKSIGFPAGNDLYSDELDDALNDMYQKKHYKNLLFYLDASYSGSMFKELDWGLKIYACSSTKPDEGSVSHYCGDKAVCDGKTVGSCLGDEFSIKWMASSELGDIWYMTVGTQFVNVAAKTKGSHAQDYGDLNNTHIRGMPVGEFQGRKEGSVKKFLKLISREEVHDTGIAIPNVDYNIYYLKMKAEKSNDKADWDEYKKELKLVSRSKYIFYEFKKEFKLPEQTDLEKVDMKCYRSLRNFYKAACGYSVERDTKYSKYFASYCTRGLPLRDAYLSLEKICS